MSIIEKYIEEENWKKARIEILKKLKNNKDDHWLITRLAITYYEEKKYKKAFQLSDRAIKLAPYCPLVLWDYASTLEMVGDTKEAIKIYHKIIRKGIEGIAYGKCGEGLNWAKALYTDCYYSLATCYLTLENKRKAKQYFEKHFNTRGKGIPSIYNIYEVKRAYKKLLNEI